MGSGSVDVALDAGEDPFAGIGEEGEYEEPVDELAGMTVDERAAAQRAALDAAGEDEPEDTEEPDDPRDEPAQETPGEEDLFAGIGEDGDYAEPVDELATMTIEERAAAARAAFDAAGEDEPEVDQESDDPRDERPDEPSDEPTSAEPHSVLWYLDNLPPPSIQRYLETTPPATKQPAYDLTESTSDSLPEEFIEEDAPEEAIVLEPGIYVHPVTSSNAEIAPGAPTLGGVVLGQPFHVSVAVPREQADKNGDGVFEDLTITLATEGGETEITLAHDPLQNTVDGVFVYRTATPLSLAGESQGIEVPGTVEGLELDSYYGAQTLTISAGDQDFSAIDVYTNNTQRGIGMISDALDAISNVLVGEITVIRKIRADPAAAADPNVVAALDGWQTRVDDRMAVLQRARTLLADPEQRPRVQLELGQFYLERLLTTDENGQLAVADNVVPFSGFETQNKYADLVNMDAHVTILENGIRNRISSGVVEDVLPAYLMGVYDQYNTWNVPGAFAWTVGGALAGEGTDHFGRPKSVTHAAVEMGLFVAMIKLPDAIVDWAAGGFGTGRLPSIGIPRFRGTPVRGNVLVPKGPGRLARETALGTQPYPGSATRPLIRLPRAEREWWQGKIASRTPADKYDEAMAAAAHELDELDNVILNAQRLGVPYAEIEQALTNARLQGFFGDDALQGLKNAITGVRKELVIRGANAEGKTIVVQPSEMGEFREFAGDIQVTNLRQEDLLMIQGIKARAEFEARYDGKPMYSPDEVEFARQLLQHGDDLKNWLEFSKTEGGLTHMFDDAAIADLRTVFGGSGPPASRIDPRRGFQRLENRQQGVQAPGEEPPANPFNSQAQTRDLPDQAGRPPTQELSAGEMEQAILNAETVRLSRPAPPARAEDARPLATLDEYRTLVQRQAAGEVLDLGQVARPGIAKIMDGRVMIQQGAGRWENTRPDEWLDLFVDARAPLPEGAVVIQRGVSPELVRQSNLLSSRGQRGSNPPIIEAVTRDIPEFVRIRVKGRDADALMSDTRNALHEELGRLESEGVDVTNLVRAMETLSPNERLALLRNDTARNQALQTGTTPVEAVPAPANPLSELDKQVIQKAFQHGRGERVEWTPDELTRLQQIAYPPSGTRPNAIHNRLMPVAEELGGRLKTLRADADDFGAVIDEANQAFLAHQEMEDLIGLAGRAGVPPERVQLLAGGLDEQSPVTALERASRGLLRAIDEARGIIHESGIPEDYFMVNRIYVAAKANGNRLTPADVEYLRARVEADEGYIGKLAQREFLDAVEEPHTILDPAAAADLEAMYRAAMGGQAAAPVSPVPPISQGSPATINLASGEAASMIGGPSGRGGTAAPVEVVILSTAGSTGPVMEAFFLNKGKAVQIQGEGIVLEPVASVDAATMRRIEEIREAALQGKPVPSNEAGGPGGGGGPLGDSWAGASVVRVVLDAYCLQADLDVPTQGMLFRIAEASKQAEFGNLATIIDASQQLYDRGALHPSGDPEDYFHSIRQWAVWAEEKDMDAEEFEDAFVEHAERNITAAGQAWNADVEEVVREYAPGRWEDVEAVLKLAGVR